MRTNGWLIAFVTMSLLLTVITISLIFIFVNPVLKLPDKKYAFYMADEEREINVLDKFESIGYRRTGVDSMDWNILWSHEYPFTRLSHILKNLKPHQKVNHWPGIYSIAHKEELSTSSDFAFIPKSFKIPSEFEEFKIYAAKRPNTKFLRKSVSHRNVSILEAGIVKKESRNILIQEFIENPYLIDGYKFDIGVFVLLTSVNPLRLYIFDDVLLRFCQSMYEQNNYSNKDTYVVQKNYLDIKAIPSLMEFHRSNSTKNTFDSYLRSKKQNPNIIWHQIENMIRKVFLKRESRIVDALHERFSENLHESFFELFKFDFLVTKEEDLRVWMLEGNMSPIFYPDEIFDNVMNLIQKQYKIDVNIEVDPLVCKENNCNNDVCSEKCELCMKCLKDREKVAVKSAYRENQYEPRRFKRIFPKPITYDFNTERELRMLDSDINKFMTHWYFEKCRSESKWCQ